MTLCVHVFTTLLVHANVLPRLVMCSFEQTHASYGILWRLQVTCARESRRDDVFGTVASGRGGEAVQGDSHEVRQPPEAVLPLQLVQPVGGGGGGNEEAQGALACAPVGLQFDDFITRSNI